MAFELFEGITIMGINRLRPAPVKDLLLQLDNFAAQVRLMDEILSVILFGSLAANKMTQASDIDIAFIIADDANQKELRSKVNDIKKCYLKWPTDMVFLKKSWFEKRKNFGGLCMEIAANGKWLYTK